MEAGADLCSGALADMCESLAITAREDVNVALRSEC